MLQVARKFVGEVVIKAREGLVEKLVEELLDEVVEEEVQDVYKEVVWGGSDLNQC